MTETATAVEEKAQGRVDVGKALELLLRGCSYSEIGRMMNVSPQAVHKRMARFIAILDDPDIVRQFDSNMDMMLSGSMVKLLSAAVDDAKIKKSSTYQLAASFGILFDKQRLVRGQSTANVDYGGMAGRAEEIAAEIRALEARLVGPILDNPPQGALSTPQDAEVIDNVEQSI